MAVSVAFPGKPDVCGAGDFLTYSPKIGSHGIGEGNFNRAVFKSHAHGVREFLFSAAGEIHAFDLVSTETLRCSFGKLSAQP